MKRYLSLLLLAPLLAACGSTTVALEPSPVRPTAAPPTSLPATVSIPPTTASTSLPATSVPPTVLPATVVPATAIPTAAQATVVPATAVPAAAPATVAPPAPQGTALLFLRGGDLWRHQVADGTEQLLASGVRSFAPNGDGTLIAAVRVVEGRSDLWLLDTATEQLLNLTNDARSEGTPSWAPDGSWAYASSAAPLPERLDWNSWSAWCGQSEVRVRSLADDADLIVGAGCDPAFAPDGKRLAFATPPERQEASGGVANSIRLVNRQGQNGWNFARAEGPDAAGAVPTGRLVYGPSFSPDGGNLAFERFVGYQSLVDLALTEMAPSFKGGGTLLAAGAGWHRPAGFVGDEGMLAVAEHNYSDARGFGGYEPWSVRVLRLGEVGSVQLPEGKRETGAQQVALLLRAQSAAWQPGTSSLALLVPTGWREDIGANEPAFPNEAPGEVRLWREQEGAGAPIVENVDFASPLAWTN